MGDNRVEYELRVTSDKVKGDMTKGEGVIAKSGGKIAKTMAALGIGTALGAAAGESIKLGATLDQSLANASTLFGDVAVDTDALKDNILALSDSTGIAADELAGSLYNAMSAGVPVTEDMGEALAFLEKSSKLAKGGFTDIDTAQSATIKTMNAYGASMEEMDKYQKILMQTQNKGITTVGELGSVLANVTPTAAAMNVSFDQVAAAIANMTAKGTPAAQATTQLNTLFAELGKEGTKASGILRGQTGQSFSELMANGYTLSDVLNLLQINLSDDARAVSDLMAQTNSATGNTYTFDEALSALNLTGSDVEGELINMFGSIEAGKAALANGGENTAGYTEALAAMSTEVDVVGEAHEKVTNTVNEKFKKTVNELKNLLIVFYTAALKPLILKLFEFKDWIVLNWPLITEQFNLFWAFVAPIFAAFIALLNEEVVPVLQMFVNWFIENLPLLQEFIFTALGVIQGFWEDWGEAILGTIEFVWDTAKFIFETVLNAIQTIIEVATAIMQGDWERVWGAIGDFFIRLWEDLTKFIGEALEDIGKIFNTIITTLTKWYIQQWQDTAELFTKLWEDLSKWFNEVLEAINKFFTEIWTGIGTWFNTKLNEISKFFTDIIKGIQQFWSDTWGNIETTFSDAVASLLSILDGFGVDIDTVIENIKTMFGGLLDFITGVFTGDWEKAWGGVQKIFGTVFDGMKNLFKTPINWIIDGINDFIDDINDIKIPDWVPGVGGKSIHISKIARLKVGMDYVPSDEFPALLHEGEAVLTKKEATRWRAGLPRFDMPFMPAENPSSVSVNNNIKLTGDIEMDGYKVGKVVLKNIDDVRGLQ